jgi:ABC-type multidrug transport system fused ATPase/permease subunit
MRRYGRFIGKHIWAIKGTLALSMVLLLLTIGLEFVHIWVQKIAIDYVVDGHYEKMLWIIVAFVTVVMFIRLLTMSADLFLNVNTAKIDDQLTRRMYDSVHKLPMTDFQNERIAKFVMHITQDVKAVGQLIAFQLPKGIAQIINVIALIVVIGISSPVILIIALTMATVYIWLGRTFHPKIKKASMDVAEKRTDLLVTIEEGISSTREVISFDRLRWERNEYLRRFQNYYSNVMQEGKLENKRMLVSDPFHWGTNLGVLGYGGYLVITGQMSIGLFTVMFQLTGQLMGNIRGVYNFFTNLSRSSAHLERILSVIEGPRIPEGTERLLGPLETLRMENISFRYDSRTNHVLQNVSLDFPVGQKIAIVGTSGGGKSTIAQLLVRFFEPTEGTFLVNGIPLNQIRTEDWSRRMTTVFQDPYLFSDTIRRNMLLGRTEISEEQMTAACKAVQIHEFIISLPLGYDTMIGERGLTLSGGQRQRIALARALLSNSEILVLDEATSALDMATERAVQESIDEWRKGSTTIVIAHRLSTVQNADVVYVLDRGQVAESGSYEELLQRRGIFSSLVQGQLIS